MSFTKTRVRDANRWVKKYPLVRVQKVPVLVTDRPVWIEAEEITFDNTNTKTHYFKISFPDTPVVTATAVESSAADDQGNVSIYIQSINKSSVVIESSENFSGTVMMQAVYVG